MRQRPNPTLKGKRQGCPRMGGGAGGSPGSWSQSLGVPTTHNQNQPQTPTPRSEQVWRNSARVLEAGRPACEFCLCPGDHRQPP